MMIYSILYENQWFILRQIKSKDLSCRLHSYRCVRGESHCLRGWSSNLSGTSLCRLWACLVRHNEHNRDSSPGSQWCFGIVLLLSWSLKNWALWSSSRVELELLLWWIWVWESRSPNYSSGMMLWKCPSDLYASFRLGYSCFWSRKLDPIYQCLHISSE